MTRCRIDSMRNNNMKYNKRLLHLDMLRLLAIYLVIFNHTGERGYMLFANDMDSAWFILYLLCSVFCKVAVPIFFMISGALLLPKQETVGELFTKRILRMLVVLLLISIPYYIWLHRDQGLRLTSFLSYIYENSASTSLWYLYSYIALLLMMPFLRSMVRGLSPADYLYLIAGYLVIVGIVPCVEFCLWGGDKTVHPSFNPVLFLTQNVFYALVGYYVEHILDVVKYGKRLIIPVVLLNMVSFAATVILTVHLLRSGETETVQLEQFFNCFICVPAITLYTLMKSMGGRIRSCWIKRYLPVLGGAVFGVYLIEKFARALTDPVYHFALPVVGSFGATLIWCFAVLILSLAVVMMLKRTPIMGKLVNRFI